MNKVAVHLPPRLAKVSHHTGKRFRHRAKISLTLRFICSKNEGTENRVVSTARIVLGTKLIPPVSCGEHLRRVARTFRRVTRDITALA